MSGFTELESSLALFNTGPCWRALNFFDFCERDGDGNCEL